MFTASNVETGTHTAHTSANAFTAPENEPKNMP